MLVTNLAEILVVMVQKWEIPNAVKSGKVSDFKGLQHSNPVKPTKIFPSAETLPKPETLLVLNVPNKENSASVHLQLFPICFQVCYTAMYETFLSHGPV